MKKVGLKIGRTFTLPHKGMPKPVKSMGVQKPMRNRNLARGR